MSVLLLFLFLIVQCSDGRISSDGKIKDNVSTQMEIEREMVLLRFARKEKGVDVRRLLVYATNLQRKGMLRDSIRFYNTALVVSPNDSDALHLKGSAMFTQGFRKIGSRLVRRAISVSSVNNRSRSIYWNTFAEMLRAQGNVEKSVLAYDRAIELSVRKNQMILRNRGLCEEERPRSKPSNARAFYLKALNASSSSAEFSRDRKTLLLSDVSRTYLQEGRYNEALKYAEEAFKQNQDAVKFAFPYAVALHQLDRFERARQVYEHVLRLNVNHTDSMLNLGAIYQENGHFQRAVFYYRRVLNIRHQDGGAWNNLGACLVQLQRRDLAEAAFLQALDIDPTRHVLLNLAVLRSNQGRLEEAEHYFKRAIQVVTLDESISNVTRRYILTAIRVQNALNMNPIMESIEDMLESRKRVENSVDRLFNEAKMSKAFALDDPVRRLEQTGRFYLT